jgi:AcrR family transcriptional regulator
MSNGLVWFDEPEPQRVAEPLTRARIVAAAMELADEEASGEITMRTLATRLGVRSPMALYRHVGSKDGLADLMADHVYGELTVTSGQGWRPALRSLGTSGWVAVQRHPWFARLAFSRPPLGPNALTAYDAALAELDPLGLPAPTRMGFVNTVLGHVFGSGLALSEAAAPYLARITTSGKYPHFSRWATDPAREDPQPQTFEAILEWLLDGLGGLLVD